MVLSGVGGFRPSDVGMSHDHHRGGNDDGKPDEKWNPFPLRHGDNSTP